MIRDLSPRKFRVLVGAIGVRLLGAIACFAMLQILGRKVYGGLGGSPVGVNAGDWGAVNGLLLGSVIYGIALDFKYATRPWRSFRQWIRSPFGSQLKWSLGTCVAYSIGISAFPLVKGDWARLQFLPLFCLTMLVAQLGQLPIERRARRITEARKRSVELREIERVMRDEEEH